METKDWIWYSTGESAEKELDPQTTSGFWDTKKQIMWSGLEKLLHTLSQMLAASAGYLLLLKYIQ